VIPAALLAIAFFLERLEVDIPATTVRRDVLLLLWEVKGRLGKRRVHCVGLDGFRVRLLCSFHLLRWVSRARPKAP